jgi:hypothetical protein
MTLVCYPPGADWSCEYTTEQLEEMRGDTAVLAAMERSEALAWLSLSSLTGGQIATCPITVRPCRAGCAAPGTWMTAPVLWSGNFAGVRPGVYGFAPYIGPSGAWINGCGCRAAECGCSALSEVVLPAYAGQIVEVWLNGEVLDPTAYRVDNGNRLVRTDGGSWPACQNLAQDAHGDEAFSVRYYTGFAPDNTILWAAGRLATDFFLACQSKDCSLPAAAINVARTGISYEIESGLFPGGKTNIPEVDAIIGLLNPYGLHSAPVIASPDTRRTRMTTVGG